MKQNDLKKIYDYQHSDPGKRETIARREISAKFASILNRPLPKLGRVEKLVNEKTGEEIYYIAE